LYCIEGNDIKDVKDEKSTGMQVERLYCHDLYHREVYGREQRTNNITAKTSID